MHPVCPTHASGWEAGMKYSLWAAGYTLHLWVPPPFRLWCTLNSRSYIRQIRVSGSKITLHWVSSQCDHAGMSKLLLRATPHRNRAAPCSRVTMALCATAVATSHPLHHTGSISATPTRGGGPGWSRGCGCTFRAHLSLGTSAASATRPKRDWGQSFWSPVSD